jgi:hypothetical protein
MHVLTIASGVGIFRLHTSDKASFASSFMSPAATSGHRIRLRSLRERKGALVTWMRLAESHQSGKPLGGQ